jgi:dienelactone hydrolase
VVFSHCHNCVRFSAAQVAERLASHGFIVVAPDHTGNTLYDHLAGKELPLDATTLELRVGDVRFVLDTVLDPMAAAVPKSLRGRFDATKAGMMGHSFGSVTTGAVLSKDSRFRAGFAIAAPFDFIGDTKLADIKVPTFFLLAREDNSISSIGNALIRNDFKSITATDFMIEVVDAGHFSFSDICGLHSIFTAGCGHARRQTDPSTDLNYLENEGARGLAASYAAAFFRAQLTGDAAGLAFVKDGHPADIAIPGTR